MSLKVLTSQPSRHLFETIDKAKRQWVVLDSILKHFVKKKEAQHPSQEEEQLILEWLALQVKLVLAECKKRNVSSVQILLHVLVLAFHIMNIIPLGASAVKTCGLNLLHGISSQKIGTGRKVVISVSS